MDDNLNQLSMSDYIVHTLLTHEPKYSLISCQEFLVEIFSLFFPEQSYGVKNNKKCVKKK